MFQIENEQELGTDRLTCEDWDESKELARFCGHSKNSQFFFNPTQAKVNMARFGRLSLLLSSFWRMWKSVKQEPLTTRPLL